MFRAFSHDVSGATAIEYALVAGLMALVIVGAVTNLGDEVQLLYGHISTEVSKAAP